MFSANTREMQQQTWCHSQEAPINHCHIACLEDWVLNNKNYNNDNKNTELKYWVQKFALWSQFPLKHKIKLSSVEKLQN